jgi:hypothetical protein
VWGAPWRATAQLDGSSGAVQISVGQGSTGPNSKSQEPAAPPVGDLVFFSSDATNLVAGYNPDTHSTSSNVYLKRPDAALELVSSNTLGEFPGKVSGQDLQYGCYSPAVSRISLSGQYAVAFVCDANDLLPGYVPPPQNPRQIYVRFFGPGGAIITRLASGNYLDRGIRGSNGHSDQATIAIESEQPLRYRLCFRSFASDLLAPGSVPNNVPQVFCESMDPVTGTVISDSVFSVKPNFQDSNGLNQPAISVDATTLVFSSAGTVISTQPSNGFKQVYSYSLASKVFRLISTNSDSQAAVGESTAPSVSSDGSVIAFFYQPPSSGGSLQGFAGRTRPLFIRYSVSGQPPFFTQINTDAGAQPSNGDAAGGRINANPRFVVFLDNGTNLLGIAGDNPNHLRHVYIKDLSTGEVGRADVSASGVTGTADAGINLEVYFGLPVTIGRKSSEEDKMFVAFNSFAQELPSSGVPDSTRPFLYASRFEVQADTPTPTPTPTITPTNTPTATPDPSGGTPITLTKNIRIEEPPAVQLLDRRPDGSTDVFIILRRFKINPRLFGKDYFFGAEQTSKGKITYHIDLRKEGSKKRITRVLSRNTTTIRKLTPGRYTLRYTVVATKGSKQVQSRQSPPANFTIT